MKVLLSRKTLGSSLAKIDIGGSKSESNRLLVLQALYPELTIENLSDSDDTVLLERALKNSNPKTIDIHHAGTAMRFLTAFYASQQGKKVLLTGSERMKQRPIKILVDALQKMGANIEYVEEEGYPPLQINGTHLEASSISLAAGTSSQYVSALLLIAPSLKNGLVIELEGTITSIPYIKMTCNLLRQIGCKVQFSGSLLKVQPLARIAKKMIAVESDWSSASYFYSFVALSEDLSLQLSTYKEESLQGDRNLSKIYQLLGVQTTFDEANNRISLTRIKNVTYKKVILDLIETPDIAQTIAVTCFGLGLGCELSGLHTLKIKETDRLVALKTELEKLGAEVRITDASLTLKPASAITPNVTVETYNDHRMAMAFAPLAFRTDLEINNAEVVSKSFPNFWQLMAAVGIDAGFEI